MSGGSLDYGYFKVETLADELDRFHHEKPVATTLRDLVTILRELAEILRDVEWYLSGDYGAHVVRRHEEVLAEMRTLISERGEEL